MANNYDNFVLRSTQKFLFPFQTFQNSKLKVGQSKHDFAESEHTDCPTLSLSLLPQWLNFYPGLLCTANVLAASLTVAVLCVWEERERERVCACVCVCACLCMCKGKLVVINSCRKRRWVEGSARPPLIIYQARGRVKIKLKWQLLTCLASPRSSHNRQCREMFGKNSCAHALFHSWTAPARAVWTSCKRRRVGERRAQSVLLLKMYKMIHGWEDCWSLRV